LDSLVEWLVVPSEAKSGKPVVSKENYLAPPAKRKVIARSKKANEGKG